MKTSECTAEAFLCIITIFHCNIQYLHIRGSKLISRESEPAHADIISQRIAAQDTENTLKMERGGIGPVSYTHLDVYKRQVLRRAILLFAFRTRRLRSGSIP